MAFFARRFEPKRLVNCSTEFGFEFFPNAHGAVALDVGMPADRTRPATVDSDAAPHQQHVHHLLNVLRAVEVLGRTQTPTNDDPSRIADPGGGLADLFSRNPGGLGDRIPRRLPNVLQDRFDAFGVGFDKTPIDGGSFGRVVPADELFEDAFEQRNVAVDFDLQKQVRQFGWHAGHAEDFLRVHEVHQSAFG